jgi:hypothetical protein
MIAAICSAYTGSNFLAHLRLRQGRSHDAFDLLSSRYNWFKEGFETSDLREARALRDRLSET